MSLFYAVRQSRKWRPSIFISLRTVDGVETAVGKCPRATKTERRTTERGDTTVDKCSRAATGERWRIEADDTAVDKCSRAIKTALKIEVSIVLHLA